MLCMSFKLNAAQTYKFCKRIQRKIAIVGLGTKLLVRYLVLVNWFLFKKIEECYVLYECGIGVAKSEKP